MKIRILTFLVFCLTSANYLSAQVVINEFSAANFDDFWDNYNEYEDWIELYNTSSTSVDLGGYYISDKTADPTKYEIPNGVTIGPNGYLLIFASKRDEYVGGQIHTNFKINQTQDSEAIVLADPSGTIIDSNEIDIPNQNKHSRGRSTDGADDWAVFLNPTPNGPNFNPQGEYVPTPEFDVEAGVYSSANVSISCSDAQATIHYTTDGSDPTPFSPIYTDPILVTSTQVIRAIAVRDEDNIPNSFINTNNYFINTEHTIPIIAISGGEELADLLDGDFNEPIGHLEYFEANGEFIDEVTGDFNKHGNDSWAYPQRGIDFITRDQFGTSYAVKSQIFPNKERDKFQRLILKAAANDNYPFENGAHIRDAYVHTLSQRAGLELDERTYKPCVLYMNGEYWGVYEIREKVDDNDFTKEYYDQGREWIDFIKTWGGTWAEYGTWDDWYDLKDFVDNNDMTDDANFAYVDERLNMQSLVDYIILHAHNVSADWLNWNTGWWRGRKESGGAKKWRYILWDEDATFGHYINYTGIPDQSATADPCDPEEIDNFTDFEGHIELFSDLYENDAFKALYINRYADLNNSYFSCDFMIPLLDEMIGTIEPEMERQIERWGGSMSEWQSNVQGLRDYINTRCTIIDESIADCYEEDGITGPWDLNVNVDPENAGTVLINNFTPENYPWSGTYYGGIEIALTAIANENFLFDHWEVANNVFSPDELSEAIALSLESGDDITAFFLEDIPCQDPENLEFIATPGQVEINWDEAAGALSYDFRYRPAGGGDWNNFSLVEPTYTVTELDNCETFELQLRTICSFELGEFINVEFESYCETTSTEEQSNLSAVKIYPNPFRSYIISSFDLAKASDLTLQLTDISGKVIWSKVGQFPSGNTQLEIPAKFSWPGGIYILKIASEEGVFVSKLVHE